ncbi:MAG: hypothetical protein WAJ97_11265 [Terriglobales bacterium]|jgi:hypothetical protein
MATLKLVFGFVLFGMVALVCYKLLPPFFANYELEDSIKTEATQSTYSTRSEDDIRASIIKQARGYDIALTPRQVHVLRVGSFGTGTLAIDAEYSVPIDLPGYSTTLNFHPSSQNSGVY